MSKKFSGVTFRLLGHGTHILGIPYEKLFLTFMYVFYVFFEQQLKKTET